MTDRTVLEFMLILGKLKTHKRTGWVQRNIANPESIADHMYRMAVLALLLDERKTDDDGTFQEPWSLDKTRCIKVALVHDMCEAVVGDITPFCGVSVQEKHRREKDAMNSMCENLQQNVADEILSLYEEYENQITLEAQTVKDLDRFEMILQAYEYEAAAAETGAPQLLEDFFESTKGKFQNPQVARWVRQLYELRQAFQASGKAGVILDRSTPMPEKE